MVPVLAVPPVMGLDLPVTPPPPLTSFSGCRSGSLMCAFFIRRQTERVTLMLRSSLSPIPAALLNAPFTKKYALGQDNSVRVVTRVLNAPSGSADAVIRVYHTASNVIETHEHADDFKELLVELVLLARRS